MVSTDGLLDKILAMKIKILSYNIHKGFDSFGLKFTLHEIREAIQSTQADIAILQEVVGENRKFLKSIKKWPKEPQFEFLADSIWPHFAYGKNAVYDERHHGNAILSKFPIIKKENLNISTNPLEQRGLLHCELEISNQTTNLDPFRLHIFNVHLDLWQGGRKQQMAKIIQRAQEQVPHGCPFILAGDFNDWTQTLTPYFIEHLGVYESHLESFSYHAKSFPSYLPLISLDRVYFRKLRLLNCTTLSNQPWSQLSDHLPLLVEVEIET